MSKRQVIFSKRYFVFLLHIVVSILVFIAFLKMSPPAVRARKIKGKSIALAGKMDFVEAASGADLKELVNVAEGIMQGYANQKGKNKIVTEEIPDSSGVGILMKNLIRSADNSGVKVVSLRTDEMVDKEVYLELPVELTVEGGFYQFEKYLREIESFKRPMRIDYIQMDSNKKQPPVIKGVFSIRTI
ncbi:type 4a pilus biogenesis protein PilO, partial [bacterium]|nr:type 4a pilus biogenesis protein PilO [bacterium]